MHHSHPSRVDGFPLFRRERHAMRGGLVLLSTLLAMALVALLAPRAGRVIGWFGDFVDQLIA